MKKSDFLAAVLPLLMLALLPASPGVWAKSPSKNQNDDIMRRIEALWTNPAIESRIRQGIESNRKGYVTLTIVDTVGGKALQGEIYNIEAGNDHDIFMLHRGHRLEGAKVEFEQLTHEFLFGSNIFMYKGYDSPAENQRYEDAFKRLFNFATVPFFWRDLEPQMGRYRFSADSPHIYRRPAPDLVVDFCKANGIKMKGHPLMWDSEEAGLPSWYPKDEYEFKKAFRHRMDAIAQRYGDDIEYWDTVNEISNRKPWVWMPEDYAFYTFKQAERSLPIESKLIYNEVGENFFWEKFHSEYSLPYLEAQSLLERGAKIDMFGLQFHLFFDKGNVDLLLNGLRFGPDRVFDVLDSYAKLALPLNISEITIPELPLPEAGVKETEAERLVREENHAKMARWYYRLFFSHPAVRAVTWWNLADGNAWGNEGVYRSGLLRDDLSEKASFKALDELINKEWHTEGELMSDDYGNVALKGFYGRYKVKITYGGKTWETELNLSSKGPKSYLIVLR